MSQVRKDVLNGWKEIAAYLGRDPRTVERWEKQRSLPVRRLPGSGRATVYALISELDAWLASRPAREPELPQAGGAAGDTLPVVSMPATSLNGGQENRQGGSDATRDSERAAGAPVVGSEARSWRLKRLYLLAFLLAGVLGVFGWSVLRQRFARGGVPEVEIAHAGQGRRHTLVPKSAVLGVEQLYIRGCYQAEQRTPDSLRRAQDAFREVLQKDAGYAPAYAGLASTYILLREYATLPDGVAYAKAREAANAALTRDPDLPQAHAVLGFIEFFWDWHPDQAEREFRRALQADPELALTHHWYGSMLTHQGRFRDGLRELDDAQRLEPTSAAILTTRAFALGLSGQRDEATGLLEEAISNDTAGRYRNPATMHNVLGALSLIAPRNVPRYLSEALVAAELRQDTRGVESLRMASQVFQHRGEAAMWQALLQDEQQRSPGGKPTYALARLEAETGARERAMHDLLGLYTQHDPALIGLAVDPLLNPLRGEPQFDHLRSAVGLSLAASN